MKNIINFNELLKGICIIALYYLLSSIYAIPFSFLTNKLNIVILNTLYTIALTITFMLIYFKTLKKDFKDFKNNYKEYLKLGYKYWIKGFFLMIATSFIINIFVHNIPANEQLNRDFLNSNPIYEIISAILFAPILEELVFRRSLQKFTSNIHIYAITTGIIFGFIHIYSSLSNPINILYLIPYCSVSIAFGYLYFKTQNIYSTICIHSFHNLFNISLLLIGGIL